MPRMNPVKRRYLLRIAFFMALHIATLFAADYLIEDRLVSGPAAYGIALLPGLAIVGFIWAIGAYMAELDDEFLRMILVRQFVIATGVALSLASVWGYLEEFALVGHFEAFWFFVLWCFGLLVGMIATRITHGTWGDCW